jgi:hypothetical protein
MNEPNVPMYSRDSSHRCGSRSAAAEPEKSALAEEMLFIRSAAPIIAMTMSGTQIQPARGRFTAAPAPIVTTIGTTNWATEAPRLPPAALSPSAQPFSR